MNKKTYATNGKVYLEVSGTDTLTRNDTEKTEILVVLFSNVFTIEDM